MDMSSGDGVGKWYGGTKGVADQDTDRKGGYWRGRLSARKLFIKRGEQTRFFGFVKVRTMTLDCDCCPITPPVVVVLRVCGRSTVI